MVLLSPRPARRSSSASTNRIESRDFEGVFRNICADRNDPAELSAGSFLSAQMFLNTPSKSLDSILFVDALDERRAGRGDNNTIDRMVQKLFERVPDKI